MYSLRTYVYFYSPAWAGKQSDMLTSSPGQHRSDTEAPVTALCASSPDGAGAGHGAQYGGGGATLHRQHQYQ